VGLDGALALAVTRMHVLHCQPVVVDTVAFEFSGIRLLQVSLQCAPAVEPGVELQGTVPNRL
jgi:hypothetical protein